MSSSAVYPALLRLPNGVTARVRIVLARETNKRGELVTTQVVQHPPQYETDDGAAVEADVTIPTDLAAAWHWHGSTLASADGLLSISTATTGIAGAFEAARLYAGTLDRLAAARAERGMPVTKQTKRVIVADAAQAVMEFV